MESNTLLEEFSEVFENVQDDLDILEDVLKENYQEVCVESEADRLADGLDSEAGDVEGGFNFEAYVRRLDNFHLLINKGHTLFNRIYVSDYKNQDDKFLKEYLIKLLEIREELAIYAELVQETLGIVRKVLGVEYEV